MAPLVQTGGSRHTGLAAPPHRNIHSLITHKLLLLSAKVVKHSNRLPLLKKRRVIRPHQDLKIDKVVVYCLLTVLSQIFN